MGAVQQITLGIIVLGGVFIFGHFINEEKIPQPTETAQPVDYDGLVWQGAVKEHYESPITFPSMPVLKNSNKSSIATLGPQSTQPETTSVLPGNRPAMKEIGIDPPSKLSRPPVASKGLPKAPSFDPLPLETRPNPEAQRNRIASLKPAERRTAAANSTPVSKPSQFDAVAAADQAIRNIAPNQNLNDLSARNLIEEQFPGGPPSAFLQPIDDLSSIEGDHSPFNYAQPIASENINASAGSTRIADISPFADQQPVLNRSYRQFAPPQPDDGPHDNDDFAPHRARAALIPSRQDSGQPSTIPNWDEEDPNSLATRLPQNQLRYRPSNVRGPENDLRPAENQNQTSNNPTRQGNTEPYEQTVGGRDYSAPPVPDEQPQRMARREIDRNAIPFKFDNETRSRLIQVRVRQGALQLETNQFIRHQTKRGDTLQKISQRYYGKPDFYLDIYLANQKVLENPATVPVGIVLKIPKYDAVSTQ